MPGLNKGEARNALARAIRSLPSLRVISTEMTCPGLLHHLPDTRRHLIKFLAQARPTTSAATIKQCGAIA
jgi:hypothetical protein